MEVKSIQKKIYEVRGQNVMLDFDLAELYETETRILKQAVRRNILRFPEDFMFELTKNEYISLRSQFVILEKTGRGRHSKYNPFAFTEQGVAMIASVLSSAKAIEMNIQIVRTFVFLRKYSLSHKDLTSKIKELESKFERQFEDIYQAIEYLLEKDNQEIKQKQRKKIGFK